jgi:hypothetical protein
MRVSGREYGIFHGEEGKCLAEVHRNRNRSFREKALWYGYVPHFFPYWL